MTNPVLSVDSSSDALASFGTDADGPYERALRDGLDLFLCDVDLPEWGERLPIGRFLGPADQVDQSVIDGSFDGVLDLGCGPGRMLRAALSSGRRSLGVDVSSAAVEIAHAQGLPVLQRSVFQPLPREGEWGTALLLDGNIGIGGDPRALLVRSAELVAPGGRVLVETHADPAVDRSFSAILRAGGVDGDPFAWSQLGARSLRRYAMMAGLHLIREWKGAGRSFAEYATSAQSSRSRRRAR
jgi:SAM-dependent methyltransferase